MVQFGFMNQKDIIAFAIALGFEGEGDLREKLYGEYRVGIDVAKGKIDYGDKIALGDKTTSDFSQAENLVVLECVDRLLTKGYAPESLTLEERWQLGRGASGGKADIVVRDRDGKTLLIIECKTWGAEYDKAIKKMESDGGQLFSYLQQDKNAEYLCLYASRFDCNGRKYRNAIIHIADRPADEAAFAAGDKSVRLYANAGNVQEMHQAWKETYDLFRRHDGIFEDDVAPYKPKLKPLTKRDLVQLSGADKLFNRFAEILRHNNISDNANAFNRLLSLILCKIVDESKNKDDELAFQVKEGEDTTPGAAEDIHDRLHALYKRGMDQYLREKIVYYEDAEIRRIMKLYPKRTPLMDIEKMFRDIKYYTNNEFSFKEVHNKELFDQNARVLNEVIKMMQHFRFRHNTKEPILGTFFELLLNHGVKQSEGQFFTPPQIVRFILHSLGVREMIRKKLDAGEEEFLPKTLDYACGAGHFLTEMIDEIRTHLGELDASREKRAVRARITDYKKNTDWAGDYIFGVEKDYRLARTAQIACFLHGDGEANIIFGDGLENNPRLKEDDRLFDIVVANPPYSVKAFKNYLTVGEKDYPLIRHLSESASEIETLFLARTAKALRPGGLAGVIFPTSILSNGGIYEKARALMFRQFEILGVAELGGNTFIATGTNTAILFLRRRDDSYAADRDAVAADLFAGRKYKYPDYIDGQKLLDGYAEKRGFTPADYRTILRGENANAAVRKSGLWKKYESAFEELPETKKRKQHRAFCELSADEQKAEMSRRFYDFVRDHEQQLFAFYMLCMQGIGYKTDGENIYCPQIAAAVNSGTDTKMQQEFLGYKISKAKGQAGIKPLGGGKLSTVAECIRKNVLGEAISEVAEDLRTHFKTVNLLDCVDFSGVEVNNAINLKIAASTKVEIKSQWETAALGNVVNTDFGERITKENNSGTQYPVYGGGGESFRTDNFNRQDEFVISRFALSQHCVRFVRGEFWLMDSGFTISVKQEMRSKTNVAFIGYVLENIQNVIFDLSRGSQQKNLDMDRFRDIKIPLPPPNVQKKIAAECAAIDDSVESAKKEIAELRREMGEIYDSEFPQTPLGNVVSSQYGYTATAANAGGIRFLRITDIDEDGEIKESGKQYIDADDEIKKQYALSENDIVVARSGSIGKMAIYKDSHEPMIFASYLVRLTADKSALSPEYLFHFSHTARYWEQVQNLATRGNQPNLNAERIKAIKIPLPPMPRQKELVAELRKKETRINELRKQIKTAPARKAEILEENL